MVDWKLFFIFHAFSRHRRQLRERQPQQQPKYNGVSNKIAALGASEGAVAPTGGSGTAGGARQDSGDDGSLEDPDELWGKDKEQKEEHHEGEVSRKWWQAAVCAAACFRLLL